MNNDGAIAGLQYWRLAQVTLLALGGVLVLLLFVLPDLGIDLMWNVLIPAAPAVVVIIPGVWRNICPMATTGLLPRHFGRSKKKVMPQELRSKLVVASFIGLLAIVPLRHLFLNTSGPATGIMLILAAGTAIWLGFNYDWRSGWCSSLCPIHPVEKLYGSMPAITVPNVHCTECEKCVTPCPDSTHKMTPLVTNTDKTEKKIGLLLVGGFFGYVYGWYQVPDYTGSLTIMNWINAFAWPLGGFAISYMLFKFLMDNSSKSEQAVWIRLFSMFAVAAYYWYRIPMLFGFSELPNNGALIDLSDVLPIWFQTVSQIGTSAFFIWFMVVRDNKLSWSTRPAYSADIIAKSS